MDWHWDFPLYIWPFFGVFFIIALAILAFDVWMLVDAIQRPPEQFSSPDAKTWWIVGLIVGLVTGLPAIAIAIAYYIIVRRPATSAAGPKPPQTWGEPAPAGDVPPPPPGPAIPPPPANCRSCGAKIVAGARFCHSCGTPVA